MNIYCINSAHFIINELLYYSDCNIYVRISD